MKNDNNVNREGKPIRLDRNGSRRSSRLRIGMLVIFGMILLTTAIYWLSEALRSIARGGLFTR